LINAGDAYLLEYPFGSDKVHLCFVLTEQAGHPPYVFIVPVMSARGSHDTTLTLNCNDHQFIDHLSYVSYKNFRKITLDSFEEAIVTAKEAMSSELLCRVIDGITKSPFCPNGMKKLFAEHDGGLGAQAI
jgi:hypothetical protein